MVLIHNLKLEIKKSRYKGYGHYLEYIDIMANVYYVCHPPIEDKLLPYTLAVLFVEYMVRFT